MDLSYIIQYLLSSLSGIPNWVRLVIGLFGVGAIIALAMTVNVTVAIIVACGLLFVALIVFFFRYILWRRQQKRAAQFGAEMRQVSGITPGAITDPARRQRLKDIADAF